jgi:hypothetical protein
MGNEETNKIIFVLIVVVNLLITTQYWDILKMSKKYVSKCTVMGWDLDRLIRCTNVSHDSVIKWVKEAAKQLPEHPPIETMPDVGELDELQTFVGSKKT